MWLFWVCFMLLQALDLEVTKISDFLGRVAEFEYLLGFGICWILGTCDLASAGSFGF